MECTGDLSSTGDCLAFLIEQDPKNHSTGTGRDIQLAAYFVFKAMNRFYSYDEFFILYQSLNKWFFF